MSIDPAGPVVFEEPWQGRLHALRTALVERGLLTEHQVQQELSRQAARDPDGHYFELMMRTMEELTIGLGLSDRPAMRRTGLDVGSYPCGPDGSLKVLSLPLDERNRELVGPLCGPVDWSRARYLEAFWTNGEGAEESGPAGVRLFDADEAPLGEFPVSPPALRAVLLDLVPEDPAGPAR